MKPRAPTKRRRTRKVIWLPILVGFCVLTAVLLRGSFLGLRELESELSHVDSRPKPEAVSGGGAVAVAEDGVPEPAAAKKPVDPRELQQTVKSQFSEVFSGRAANSSALDKFSDRLFRREVKRIETELRNEMQRETWKIKDKTTGRIKKLKVQRLFEREEIEYYKQRRSKDANRLLKVFSSSAFSCLDAEGCKKAMEFQVKRDFTFDSEAFALPYAEPCEAAHGNVTRNGCDGRADPAIAAHDSCAVVGNSGVMKRSHKGPAIDRSSAVFRINQAPTSGHVADVGMPFNGGAKATYRVLNNAWAQIYAGIFHNHKHYDFAKLPLEKNCTLLLTRSQPQTSVALMENLRKNGREDVRVYELSQQMMQRTREVMINYRMLSDRVAEMEHRWKQNQVKGGTTPSTGFVGIMIAKRLCKDVAVFGLSKEASRDASSSTWSYHYFQQSHRQIDLPTAELRAHPHHSFRLEGRILDDLVKAGVVGSGASAFGDGSGGAFDWAGESTAGKGGEDHSKGCPAVRTPDSGCGGAPEPPPVEPELAAGEAAGVVKEPARPSGQGSRRQGSRSKRARKSPAREEDGGRRGRTRLSTQVVTKRNHDRARLAQPRDAMQNKELQELEEILKAQAEQNERASRVKKPKNNKHVPLDKIEDPEERKREEIWRADEAKRSGAQIDEKCLAKGSSDPCFQRWMKGQGVARQADP